MPTKIRVLALSSAALENLSEVGMTDSDVQADILRLRSGDKSATELLRDCLDGADADREDGWTDYVRAVEVEADNQNSFSAVALPPGTTRGR
jgi:hypothetical protein